MGAYGSPELYPQDNECKSPAGKPPKNNTAKKIIAVITGAICYPLGTSMMVIANDSIGVWKYIALFVTALFLICITAIIKRLWAKKKVWPFAVTALVMFLAVFVMFPFTYSPPISPSISASVPSSKLESSAESSKLDNSKPTESRFISSQVSAPTTVQDLSGLTRANYDKIKDGTTYEECCKIFGAKGKSQYNTRTGSTSFDEYVWENGSAQIIISFQDGKAVSMGEYGLE